MAGSADARTRAIWGLDDTLSHLDMGDKGLSKTWRLPGGQGTAPHGSTAMAQGETNLRWLLGFTRSFYCTSQIIILFYSHFIPFPRPFLVIYSLLWANCVRNGSWSLLFSVDTSVSGQLTQQLTGGFL